jgi:ribosome-associated protein
MKKIEFEITDPFIELIKLLKAEGIAETGGHAKGIVERGEVLRNGEVELRKRAKLIVGDVIEVRGETIEIVQGTDEILS